MRACFATAVLCILACGCDSRSLGVGRAGAGGRGGAGSGNGGGGGADAHEDGGGSGGGGGAVDAQAGDHSQGTAGTAGGARVDGAAGAAGAADARDAGDARPDLGPPPPCPASGPVCGDGIVCGNEVCDDGHRTACGPCNADCTGPGTGLGFCGDRKVCEDAGEVCDDGHRTACGPCNADCTGPGVASVCGDGVRCEDDELCDDHFTTACGPCNATCSGPGSGTNCTDGVLCPDTEIGVDCGLQCGPCGTGGVCANDADCGGGTCVGPGRCSACGNGVIDAGERCDGARLPVGLDVTSAVACLGPADPNACRLDLSRVGQLYCDIDCAGGFGPLGCDQADADALCRLQTGWAGAVASQYTITTVTHAPGFGCSSGTGLLSLGPLPEYGVATDVRYAADLAAVAGAEGRVVSAVVCSRPVCGNGMREPGERCDGTDGVIPGGEVRCRADAANACRFDFSAVSQLYCEGTCSLVGAPECDEEDAHLFCRLKLGSPTARAVAFTISTPLDAPGFDCTQLGNGIDLGPMPEYGIDRVIRYNPLSLARFHTNATDEAVVSAVTCVP